MNIKQSLLIIFLSSLFSLGAFGATNHEYFAVYGECGGSSVYSGTIDGVGALWAASGECISKVVRPCTYSGHAYGEVFCIDNRKVRHSIKYHRLTKQCALDEVYNSETGECEIPNKCPDGQRENLEGECVCNDGSKPNMLGVCDDYCNSEEFNQLKREKLIMCSNTGGKFSYECNSRTDVTFNCDKKSDPDGDGDGDGDDGDGSGGTGDGGDGTGGTGAGDGDGTGDNQDFGQVVNAIDNMKTDNNTRLDKLLSSLDENSKNETKSLDGISDSISAASDKNEQSLDRINSSIGNLNNTLRDSNSIARELSSNEVSAIEGVNGSIGRLDDTLKGLADDITSTNSSSVGVGVCGVGTCESFYTAKYPEGVQGVISTHYNSISGTVTSGIKNVFGTVNLSGGSRPAYSASLDFGFANYGTFDIYREAFLNIVFTFLRAYFLVSCIFYCRSLVFGG
ncbi:MULTISPECIES: hypothetical protein [unclassified Vibrio]|uniref:hypothetical protein n=1 Tax=unclassified Vibrio TaxID=2614977 RepID=UPI00255513FF|nr:MULTISPECIES: hypothetical protein [unclassified Vibrio]MDK9777471.1 hypothetical protein [Vibrio sp. D401a]MDK9808807.1 hypothetical protein [Vibrio sp. D406a]